MNKEDIQRMISDCDKVLKEYRNILEASKTFPNPQKKMANMLWRMRVSDVPNLIRLCKLEKNILQRALSGHRQNHQVWVVKLWSPSEGNVDLFIGPSFKNAKKYIMKSWGILKNKLANPLIEDYEVNIYSEIQSYVMEIRYVKRNTDGVLVDKFLKIGTLNYTNIMDVSHYVRMDAWGL